MESFGARLKREREQRKITLDDISLATKIGTRFLAALEAEHFDQLPGGIFNKGFVRAYARHLGIDENQAIADFVAASAPTLPESPAEDTPVLAAMAVRVPESKKMSRGIRSEQTQPASPESAGAASQAPPAGSSAGSPEAATPAAGAVSNAGAFTVLIKAREDSWVSITADGQPVMQDTVTSAAEKSVQAHNQIVIKTGNVGALDISFNGKKLAPQGRDNQVKTLTFDLKGLRP